MPTIDYWLMPANSNVQAYLRNQEYDIHSNLIAIQNKPADNDLTGFGRIEIIILGVPVSAIPGLPFDYLSMPRTPPRRRGPSPEDSPRERIDVPDIRRDDDIGDSGGDYDQIIRIPPHQIPIPPGGNPQNPGIYSHKHL